MVQAAKIVVYPFKDSDSELLSTALSPVFVDRFNGRRSEALICICGYRRTEGLSMQRRSVFVGSSPDRSLTWRLRTAVSALVHEGIVGGPSSIVSSPPLRDGPDLRRGSAADSDQATQIQSPARDGAWEPAAVSDVIRPH
jgi:hypothetical protein